ncbi:MAG: hypothetical protein ACE148_10375 [Vicinamibacterales bacterium]
MDQVLVLAASEQVRAAGAIIESALPGTVVRVEANPLALAGALTDRPTAVLLDDTALNVAGASLEAARRGDSVYVLLSAQPLVVSAPEEMARKECRYVDLADLIFAVPPALPVPEAVVLSAVRAADDLLRIERRREPGFPIFLVVDDEPRWFSVFLPVLYDVIGHRAAVRVARTYEDAVAFLFGTADGNRIDGAVEAGRSRDVIGLVTDLYFPRCGVVSGDSGRDLIALVARRCPQLPIVVASKSCEPLEAAGCLLAVRKGEPGFLEALRACVRDRIGPACSARTAPG